MRAPLLRLTGRGLALLVLGAAIAIAAAVIGEPDVVWIGLLMVVLPVLGLVLVGLTHPRLRMQRRVEPEEVPLGSRPRVVIELENRFPASVSALDFRDRAPSEFGSDAKFSLVRGLGAWQQPVGYELQANHRGHFRLGPLRATATDPMGMASYSWSVPGDDATLSVTPRVHPLARLKDSMGAGSSGDATPQRIGQAGQDDVLVREHRHGDDLRRVHWRMSAKQGELMVRLEEHPWDPSATLVIDTRAGAHFGEGPEGTLEWCISLGASVAAELLSARYRVTILSADSEVLSPGHVDNLSGRQRMLRRLTDVTPSEASTLMEGLEDSTGTGNSQSIVGALGLLGAGDAAALTAVGSRMLQCAALVPDAAAFGAGAAVVAAHDDACRLLEAEGWTIQRYRPGQSVPDAWLAMLARREAR
ncbi:DUF58 domain-containing protein [Tessaracoccus rhinocerotis]|uniref:DUF58 domain-containing protein n=1 Tax=Tessaracoccus rhinocerotis TaxID=1689449 RepID=A0A553K2E0_9ACTN|nr:DUF58 domain-containing protein [Tessaracoccus rhinocerotis]TRY18883.1 DUF58 domain-containing protein [Tessaracoccus rhinocerotis]